MTRLGTPFVTGVEQSEALNSEASIAEGSHEQPLITDIVL